MLWVIESIEGHTICVFRGNWMHAQKNQKIKLRNREYMNILFFRERSLNFVLPYAT